MPVTADWARWTISLTPYRATSYIPVPYCVPLQLGWGTFLAREARSLPAPSHTGQLWWVGRTTHLSIIWHYDVRCLMDRLSQQPTDFQALENYSTRGFHQPYACQLGSKEHRAGKLLPTPISYMSEFATGKSNNAANPAESLYLPCTWCHTYHLVGSRLVCFGGKWPCGSNSVHELEISHSELRVK